MEFEDTVTVEAEREELWQLISDPEILVTCIPGAKEVEKLSETKFAGVIERGIAGISLELDGEVEIVEMDEPEHLAAEGSADDRRTNSHLDATAEMDMAEPVDGETELSYYVDMTFTGRLASIGGRIAKRKISSDIDTYFENLRAEAEE